MSERSPDENGHDGSTTALAPPAEPAGFRRVVFYSLLTSLCPLIPLPLLDDWARDLLRRRLAGELARERGQPLADGDVKILACGHHPLTLEGCLRGCVVVIFTKVVLKIVKKIFRKILFFLTIKDCVVTFSGTFHEAYLVRHALDLGVVPANGALDVRRAIEAAVREPDHRPIERLARRTFRGSWGLLGRGARQLTRLFKGLRRSGREDDDLLREELPLDEEERVLGGLVDELTEELGQETGYLRHLEALFEKHLAAAEPPQGPQGA